MNRFTVAGDGATAVDAEIPTGIFRGANVTNGIAIHIDIVTVGEFHTGNTAFVDIVVYDLHILAAFTHNADGATAEEAAVLYQNILAVAESQDTAPAGARFLCMAYSQTLHMNVAAVFKHDHISVSGNRRKDIYSMILSCTPDSKIGYTGND